MKIYRITTISSIEKQYYIAAHNKKAAVKEINNHTPSSCFQHNCIIKEIKILDAEKTAKD